MGSSSDLSMIKYGGEFCISSYIIIYPEGSESESEVAQLCPTLCNPMDCIAYQALQSMEFSSQEYWSGLPFPSPGDLPNPGIEPRSPALQADTLPSEPPEKEPKLTIFKNSYLDCCQKITTAKERLEKG